MECTIFAYYFVILFISFADSNKVVISKVVGGSTGKDASNGTYSSAIILTKKEIQKTSKKSEEELAREIDKNGVENTKNGTITITEMESIDRSLDVGVADTHWIITFSLYTLKDPAVGKLITYETPLSETNWNTSENSVFLIHGYSHYNSESNPLAYNLKTSINIKRAFMESNRTENVIVMDWRMVSRDINYYSAARNTMVVGQTLGDMIISLKFRGFLNYTQVYLVGFSLGAHISGVAGHNIYEKVDENIGRITGLDPAGPGFDITVDINRRLDSSDAQYVDVIHCNAGELIPYRYLGTTLECGHTDFFPNGGTIQPNCGTKDFVQVNRCSNVKCTQLYASSVRGVQYKGCTCEDTQKSSIGECEKCDGPLMGYGSQNNSKGKYYLKAVPLERDTIGSIYF